MIFAAGKTILSCIFQDGVDEKIGSEMQSGLPWGTQRSLRDTYHGSVPLSPLPLTADLEWAQSRRLTLLDDALDCQAWLGSSMWPSPLWGLLGPQPVCTGEVGCLRPRAGEGCGRGTHRAGRRRARVSCPQLHASLQHAFCLLPVGSYTTFTEAECLRASAAAKKQVYPP